MIARELSPWELSPRTVSSAVYLGQNSNYLQQKKSRADCALVILGHPSWHCAPGASRSEAKFIPSF